LDATQMLVEALLRQRHAQRGEVGQHAPPQLFKRALLRRNRLRSTHLVWIRLRRLGLRRGAVVFHREALQVGTDTPPWDAAARADRDATARAVRGPRRPSSPAGSWAGPWPPECAPPPAARR